MSGTVTIGKVRLVDEYISDQILSIEEEQVVVSARMTTVEQELVDVQSAILTSDTTAVSNRVTVVEQDVSSLESKDLTLASATTAVSTRVTAVEQDISSLESKDVTLASATTAVSNRVTVVEQDVGALESKDVTLASATTAVSNRVTATEQNLVNIGGFISTNSNNRTTITGNDGIYFNINGEIPIYLTASGGLSVTMASTNTYLNYAGTGRNYLCCDSDEFTEFRTGSTRRAYVDATGLYAGTTNVGTKLTELEGRLADIEQYFLDTRRTVNIKNHVAGKYLDQGGTLTASKSSTNAHYSIEFD